MKRTGSGIRQWLDMAEKAALKAGAFLKKNRGSSAGIRSKHGRDIKTTADMAAERIILDYLKKRSSFSILSEESGFFAGDGRGPGWIVDPIDGTFNYVRGIPLCCVSIGLWDGNKPLLGVIYGFDADEMFSGAVSHGAFLNGRPIKASSVSEKGKAVFCTGLPVHRDYSLNGLRKMAKDMRGYKKVRFLGSAALSIAYVAAGRADVYSEEGIMFWDVAGGIPIALAAGGMARVDKSRSKNSYTAIVSNRKIFEKI